MNKDEQTPRPEPRPIQRSPYGGLCADCVHARVIASDKGSVFVLCERAKTDARFSRYPPQPVVACRGFER